MDAGEPSPSRWLLVRLSFVCVWVAAALTPSQVEALQAKAQAQAEQRRLSLERHRRVVEIPSTAAKQPYEPDMVRIPAGSFTMGCLSEDEDCQEDERPTRKVRIDEFWMSKTEITFAQFDAYIEATGGEKPKDRDWGRGDRPAIYVSRSDVQQYIHWLNQQTGKRYRLPSEAEWEYAARAGTKSKYFWGDIIGDNRANCGSCGSQWDSKQTAPVASFAANAWGLYDVHGNVWEWVQDRWHPNYENAPTSSKPWRNGSLPNGVVRGGSWYFDPRMLRSASRLSLRPDLRLNFIGFRLAEDR